MNDSRVSDRPQPYVNPGRHRGEGIRQSDDTVAKALSPLVSILATKATRPLLDAIVVIWRMRLPVATVIDIAVSRKRYEVVRIEYRVAATRTARFSLSFLLALPYRRRHALI